LVNRGIMQRNLITWKIIMPSRFICTVPHVTAGLTETEPQVSLGRSMRMLSRSAESSHCDRHTGDFQKVDNTFR
jgi:hypothetical protein